MREEARKEREQRREGIVESTEEQGGGQTVKERGDEDWEEQINTVCLY
jgi:hypothetical protein